MENEKKKMKLCVSTTDLFNSADGSGFFVVKGEVKELPEELTPIIENAIAQGLLREPSEEEISKYEYKRDMEKALKERKFLPGTDYKKTVERYQEYLDSQKKEVVVDNSSQENLTKIKEENKELKEEIGLLKKKLEEKIHSNYSSGKDMSADLIDVEEKKEKKIKK